MRKQRVWLATVTLALTSFLVLAAGRPWAHGQTTKKTAESEDKASLWMKSKLVNSKNVLEALTREDFAAIQENAQAMQFVGYLEKWFRADVDGYKEQMQVFQFANTSLVKAAKAKNLDGATLAYNQLTISCVQCHKIVRGTSR
jgi:hypothetical protein